MKKIIGFIVASSVCFCLFGTDAQANVYNLLNNEMRFVTSETLPLKAYPSPSSATTYTLKKGDVVYTAGDVYAGWIRVSTNSYSGYVNASRLTEVKAYGQVWKPYYVIQQVMANTTMYESSGDSATVTLSKGSFVTINRNDLHRPFPVQAKTLSLKTKIGSVNGAHVQSIAPTIRMSSAANGIAVKEYPSPFAKTILTIPKNMPFSSYGQVAGGWKVIQYGEKIGYVNGAAALAVKPTTRYVLAEGLPIYITPSRSAASYQLLAQGAEVQVYSHSLGWSYVQMGEVAGYVPANMLSATKPKSATQTDIAGVKVDARATNVSATETMKDEKGRTVYIQTTRFGLGVQLAGSNAIYLQKNRGAAAALAKQLEKDTGQKLFSCEGYELCQYEKGRFTSVISLDLNYFYDTMRMKRMGKGQVQIGGIGGSYQDAHYWVDYVTYTFDSATKKWNKTGQVTYSFEYAEDYGYSEGYSEKVKEFATWQQNPSYVIQEALAK